VLRYCINHDDNDLRYAAYCHGLGSIYYEKGDLNQAGYFYAKGIERLKENYINSREYRALLSDIGQMYTAVHSYDNASKYLNKAKILYEHNLDMDADYARVLNNCALVSLAQGNDFWAKAFIDVTLEIASKSRNYQAENKAMTYSNIAVIYQSMGYYDEALQASQMALDLCETEHLGNNIKAQAINNRGILYLNQHNIAAALEAFQSAFDLSDRRMSIRGTISFNLALTQQMANSKKLAQTVRQMSDELSEEVLSKFAFLNANQRLQYWTANLSLLLGVNHIVSKQQDERLYDVIYNNALFSKGLLLRATNWIDNKLTSNTTERSTTLYAELKQLQNKLTNGDVPADSIQAYRLKAFTLDKELMNENISYAELKKTFTFNWRDIQKSLSPDEVAIEFVQIPGVKDLEFNGTMKYAAMILKSDYKHPHLVTLCNDSILTKLLANTTNYDNETYRQYLYGNGTHKIRKGLRTISLTCIGDSLYRYIWEPISSELSNVKTVYYSPIGALSSVSFGAISSNDTSLSDRYDLHLLSSTAEILELKQNHNKLPENAVVYGGIQYDVEEDVLVAEARSYGEASRGITVSIPDSDGERGSWSFLTGSEAEAKEVAHKLDSIAVPNRLLMATAANEESFKSLSGKSPTLLHIATHGFYIADSLAIQQNAFFKNVSSNSVMNRSGILFSGANRAWIGQKSVDGIEDGILTADEISKLDLSQTKIAILSACETGLGQDGMTEGVYGLQRAFKLAGVQTLVMSLWQVPDTATSQLMQTFYDNWLSGMEKHDAFVKAQQTIKKAYPNPYFWAGFVMLD
jgi:CHAT domain-containing protein